jgi:hypothetical protein
MFVFCNKLLLEYPVFNKQRLQVQAGCHPAPDLLGFWFSTPGKSAFVISNKNALTGRKINWRDDIVDISEIRGIFVGNHTV